MSKTAWLWVAFNIFVLGMLAVDLGLFNRKAHVVGTREAARWSLVVVLVSVTFGWGIYHFRGSQAGLEFFAGYLIELALSVDNVFVFILLFAYFRVPPRFQHRVLFWGILGALVMRGLMIGAGSLLIERFHWVVYILGAFLVWTGIRMTMHDEIEVAPEANIVLNLFGRIMPVTGTYDGQKFFTRIDIGGRLRLAATPLFVVLVMLETTDLVFAVDSIPAVFGVTRDPFLVYTSNVFAIIGLRSMYFLLARVIRRLRYLNTGLAAVLVFVGFKMLVTIFHVEIPIGISLGVVASILGIASAASLLFPGSPEDQAAAASQEEDSVPPTPPLEDGAG